MYYDGSIASRLRELQRELDAAYARVNYVQTLLAGAYEQIRDLEEENADLKDKIPNSFNLETNRTSEFAKSISEIVKTKESK